MRAFAVDRNQVFRPCVSVGRGAGAGILGGLESAGVGFGELLGIWKGGERGWDVRGFCEETFDVVHCDEGGR